MLSHTQTTNDTWCCSLVDSVLLRLLFIYYYIYGERIHWSELRFNMYNMCNMCNMDVNRWVFSRWAYFPCTFKVTIVMKNKIHWIVSSHQQIFEPLSAMHAACTMHIRKMFQFFNDSHSDVFKSHEEHEDAINCMATLQNIKLQLAHAHFCIETPSHTHRHKHTSPHLGIAAIVNNVQWMVI